MEMILKFCDEGEEGCYETSKFKRAVTADDAYRALYDINQKFRAITRYNEGDKYTQEQLGIIDEIWDEITEIVSEAVDMELYN